MEREDIIKMLTELLKGDENVHALWLEGSDATGKVDAYIQRCFLVHVPCWKKQK